MSEGLPPEAGATDEVAPILIQVDNPPVRSRLGTEERHGDRVGSRAEVGRVAWVEGPVR